MRNILKFTQNSLVVLIYLCLFFHSDALWWHYYVILHFFCFNGFNQTAIVLRYSAHIKPRKTIKTIKTEKLP